jgi:hypothetical protein
MTDENLLQSARRTQTIIWLAFVSEPLVYVALALVVSFERAEGVEQVAEPYLRWVFYLLAAVLAVASPLVRRFLLSERQLEALRGGGTSVLADASSRYLTASLVSWSLNSFIPVGGLILLFISGDGMTILVLAAAAMVLNLLAYPQLDAFVERVGESSYDLGRS